MLRDGGGELAAEGRGLAEREYSIEALAERIAAPVGSDGRLRWLTAALAPSRVGGHNPVRFLGHAAGAVMGRRYPFVLCYHGVGAIAAAQRPSSIFLGRSSSRVTSR